MDRGGDKDHEVPNNNGNSSGGDEELTDDVHHTPSMKMIHDGTHRGVAMAGEEEDPEDYERVPVSNINIYNRNNANTNSNNINTFNNKMNANVRNNASSAFMNNGFANNVGGNGYDIRNGTF